MRAVIADAGPLMALAKVDRLDLLFKQFSRILTPPAVHDEVVVAGQLLGFPDAALLKRCYDERAIEIVAPGLSSLPVPLPLGRGEEESIRLAIEHGADWLLIDDRDARQGALKVFQVAGCATQIKGTLGVVVSACQAGLLSRSEAKKIIQELGQRSDIWISPELCHRVIDLLDRSL